jgi:ribonuclease HI
MAWARARFKGQQVWAEVDAEGAPVVTGGRIAVRYSDKAGATIYQAGASRVEPSGQRPVELPEGQAAAPSASDEGSGGGGPAPRNAPPSGRGSGFGSAGSRTAAQATAAKGAAVAQVAAAADAVRCFTDGACTGNPGPAGSGLLVKFPDGRVVERHRALGFSTNNVGELTAIDMALDELDAAGLPAAGVAVIFSDSQYAKGVLTQGWKAKANVELIAGIRARLRARPGVSLQWVAGHVGLAENERADALARKGVEESRRR